jgi:hypothetical protein
VLNAEKGDEQGSIQRASDSVQVPPRLPACRRAPISSDIAQCQKDQLGGCLIIGEMAARLDDLA